MQRKQQHIHTHNTGKNTGPEKRENKLIDRNSVRHAEYSQSTRKFN